MAHDRGLGQAGGAGGVDQETGILHADAQAVRWVVLRLAAAQLHEIGPAARRPPRIDQAVLIGHPVAASMRVVQVLGDFLEGSEQLVADHQEARFDQIEAMRQDLAALGGVDQCADGTELAQGGEDRQQLQAVFQHHRDHVAMPDTFALERPGQAVGPGIEVAVVDLALLVHQRRAFGVMPGGALQRPGQRQRFLAVADTGVVEAAQHARHARQVLRQVGQKANGRNQIGLAHGARTWGVSRGTRGLTLVGLAGRSHGSGACGRGQIGK